MRARHLAKIVAVLTRASFGVLGVLALVAGGAGPAGCSTSSPYTDPCPDADGSLTIGAYCDQILPAMCEYAVSTCGVGGTVDSCVVNARPTCCQGTCSRQVCPVPRSALDACVKEYAGPDAGLATADDAGDEDAGVVVDAGASCQGVSVGLAPAACQSFIVLR